MSRWPSRRLGDICKFKPPKREAQSSLDKSDLVSFAPMNDLGVHKKYLNASEDRPLCDVAGSYTYFADGDVLVAKITPCFENGKLGVARNLTNGVGFGSSEFTVIRPGLEIDADYLYYFLERDSFRQLGAKVMTGAVGHRRVPQEFVEAQEIPLPPLEEQRRIVAVLDEAFAAIATATANAEKNLSNARELFESYGETLFSELINSGTKTVALGDLTIPGAGITYGVVKPGGEGSVAFVRGGDLVNGVVRTDQLRTISKEFSEQYRRTLLRGGELLICLVGTPGQCAIAPMELVGANIARQVGMIRLRNELNVEFVRDYLLSAPGQRALGLKTGGSVQQVINLSDLKLIEIPIPDAFDQSGIVEKIRSMKKSTLTLERCYRVKLAELATLKQSLLYRAFTGELTATAQQNEAA